MMRNLPGRQRGNTLTGIIIGLIVGLVIAVIVALAITKGSSPFSEKTPKAGASSTPAQIADPNRPLYGNRDAAREANKEIMQKAKPADDPLGAAIAGMNATAAAPAPAAAAPAASAHAAPAASHPLAASQPAKTEGESYYLQAGAFRELSDAEASRAKLALLGFEASLSDRASDGVVLHRVRIGPFTQTEAMNKARAKLLDSGVDVAVIRKQN